MAEYRMGLPDDAIAQAKNTLCHYLFNGDTQTWTSKEIHKDPAGNIIKTVEKIAKVAKGPPPWVIDRVRGKSYDELEAVKTLVEAEWLPREILYNCGASMEQLRTEMQRLFESMNTHE